MWQKARIIDQDFEPASYRGQELWVKDTPFYAAFHELKREEGIVYSNPDVNLPKIEGRWMLTNLGFLSGQHARVWLGSIELLPDFRETVPFVALNTGEVINDSI